MRAVLFLAKQQQYIKIDKFLPCTYFIAADEF